EWPVSRCSVQESRSCGRSSARAWVALMIAVAPARKSREGFYKMHKKFNDAWICDAVRTPIGRYGGSLSPVRTDDLAPVPLKALLQRYTNKDIDVSYDVILV